MRISCCLTSVLENTKRVKGAKKSIFCARTQRNENAQRCQVPTKKGLNLCLITINNDKLSDVKFVVPLSLDGEMSRKAIIPLSSSVFVGRLQSSVLRHVLWNVGRGKRIHPSL